MCDDQYFCDFGFSRTGKLYFVIMSGDNLLSLDELTTEVSRMLQEYGLSNAQLDHRVSAVPDVRTIRYYTTLGLLDRPIIEPPRQAKYKSRHVWQLLAIKALQGAQLSLAEVQSRLYGLSEDELKAVVEAVKGSITRVDSQQSDVQSVIWREFMLAPGLKVMVAEGCTFASESEQRVIQDKMQAVLEAAARASSAKRANGGSND
jgi:DNA-binding transcriptional MerR regulator